MRLVMEGVRKSWPTPGCSGFVTALECVDLAIENGEFCLLQGPSGSGKTTLLSIIAGLANPSAGRVFRDGVTGKPAVGTVSCGFQEPVFVPELTVLENLLLPSLLQGVSLTGNRGEYLLEQFGLSPLFDLFPYALSGGEKRRLTLARSLLLPSRLLLLDEPVAYLDEFWSARVMELVLEEAAHWGTTLLIATHNPVPGAEAARVVRMARGRVVEDCNRVLSGLPIN